MSAYIQFNGMTFPNPMDPMDVELALRHGEPSREQNLLAASFVAAYKQLVLDTSAERNPKICAIRTFMAQEKEVGEVPR